MGESPNEESATDTLLLSHRAYTALSNYFSEHQDDVIEIEILPPALQPEDGIMMVEGVHLGIAKKALALAFLKAREVFFANVKAADISPVALEATKAILLFDPEHTTAANYRKRHLLHVKSSGEKSLNKVFEVAMKREIAFLDSILTSPLHRQSKSPTLWYHRAWLLDHLFPTLFAPHSDTKATLSPFLQAELDAVCKSGEQHPKNYYAWQYARRLFRKACNLILSTQESSYTIALPSSSILEPYVIPVTDWCCKHPSDISGWSFLLFLLRSLGSIQLWQKTTIEVAKYATKFQLGQESLWLFIGSALSEPTLEDHGDDVLRILQASLTELDGIHQDSMLCDRLKVTLKRVDRNTGHA